MYVCVCVCVYACTHVCLFVIVVLTCALWTFRVGKCLVGWLSSQSKEKKLYITKEGYGRGLL